MASLGSRDSMPFWVSWYIVASQLVVGILALLVPCSAVTFRACQDFEASGSSFDIIASWYCCDSNGYFEGWPSKALELHGLRMPERLRASCSAARELTDRLRPDHCVEVKSLIDKLTVVIEGSGASFRSEKLECCRFSECFTLAVQATACGSS